MPWPRLPSPRSARLLLYGSVDLPHSRPVSAPISGLSTSLPLQPGKKYTGKDLKRRRPTFEYARIRAAVSRQPRRDRKQSLSMRAEDEGFVGQSIPVRFSPPPPSSLPLRGCLVLPGLCPPRAPDRRVHFGDVTEMEVGRWIKASLEYPFPPPPHAHFPARARHFGLRRFHSPPSHSPPSLPGVIVHETQRLRSGKYLVVYTSRPNPHLVIGLILASLSFAFLLNALASRFDIVL